MESANNETLSECSGQPTLEDYRQWIRFCILFIVALAVGYVISTAKAAHTDSPAQFAAPIVNTQQ